MSTRLDWMESGRSPTVSGQLEHESATRSLGWSLAKSMSPGTHLGIVGPLGAGKTTLMQGFMDATGRGDMVRSPTYTLVNTYRGDPTVHHMDLYRLDTPDDLESIGVWEYLEDPDAICCLEWVDRFWPCLRATDIVLRLRLHPGCRQFELTAGPGTSWCVDLFRDFLGESLETLS